ncbi:MAG: metallopeptidase TldD-related protein [Myxococcota bacterium]|jgi:TldD protein|nr:metallopeptidase TldD-related protein [Myxococcota bacterium]
MKPEASESFYFSTAFGVSSEDLRAVLSEALRRGGDFAEIFIQHHSGSFVGFEDGAVNRAYVQVDLGAGVRVLKGDQTGYAYTEDLKRESLLRAAGTAASIADHGACKVVAPWARGVAVGGLYPTQRLFAQVLPQAQIGLVRRVGEKLASRDRRVVKASVSFAGEDEVVLVANSEGVLVEDTRPMTHLLAACVMEQDGKRESNAYAQSRRAGMEMYDEALLDEIVEQAVARTAFLFDAGSPPAGDMPVVLAPATSGILLHEAMGHGFEADFNRKGVSIFSSMLGKTITSPFVNIVDSGLIPGARGSIHIDDEGVPAQRTVLVENGKLVSYLHDRLSAAHYQVSPTGNGRREDFRCPPLPRMRVTMMDSGPHDPREIIAAVSKGIYAVDFANGEVAIGAGDYSFYVKSGFLIEDGKLTRPIKDVNLIGNGPDTLSKVMMVGNDSAIDVGTWACGKEGQSVPVGLGMPTVLVSSITVGGVNA